MAREHARLAAPPQAGGKFGIEICGVVTAERLDRGITAEIIAARLTASRFPSSPYEVTPNDFVPEAQQGVGQRKQELADAVGNRNRLPFDEHDFHESLPGRWNNIRPVKSKTYDGKTSFTLATSRGRDSRMHSRLARALASGLLILIAFRSNAALWAGGSGLDVLVVVNQNSSNSVQLGNYYCEQRGVPPQNVLRVNWTGGNTNWTRAVFQSTVVAPLTAMLAARGLTNQIDYVILAMDLPYRVTDTNGENSTTSALFYGFVPDDPSPGPGLPASCSLPNASANAYSGSEQPFRTIAPGTRTNTWLVTMLTASNLNLAKQTVDQGTRSDDSFPTQTVYLAKSSDPARNVRFVGYDNAEFNARMNGKYSIQRINSDSPLRIAGHAFRLPEWLV